MRHYPKSDSYSGPPSATSDGWPALAGKSPSRKPQSGKGGWEFCYVVWRFGRIWG